MDLYRVEVNNYIETQEIASKLSNYLSPGSLITLEGDLGAGKTVFTQGIAKGLGVKGVVNSPTFTIIKEYHGRLPLYHMDVYRLEDGIDDLGFEEYFFGDGITVVEWASIIEDYLPDMYLNVIIEKESEDKRIILFKPVGIKYEQLCKEFFENENFSN